MICITYALSGRDLAGPEHREPSEHSYFGESIMRHEWFGSVAIDF